MSMDVSLRERKFLLSHTPCIFILSPVEGALYSYTKHSMDIVFGLIAYYRPCAHDAKGKRVIGHMFKSQSGKKGVILTRIYSCVGYHRILARNRQPMANHIYTASGFTKRMRILDLGHSHKLRRWGVWKQLLATLQSTYLKTRC